MKNSTKNIFIFVLFVVLAGGIYAWFYPLNRGTVMVSTGLSDYAVLAEGKRIACDIDPCKIILKAQGQALQIQKEGFLPETISVSIERFKTETVAVHLKKRSAFRESQWLPNEEGGLASKAFLDLSDPLPYESGLWPTFAFDKDGGQQAVFDGSLVRVRSGDLMRTVTPLENVDGRKLRLLWAPDGKNLLGVYGRDLYWMDTKAASRRKQVLDFDAKQFIWSPNSDFMLVASVEGKIMRLETHKTSVEPLNLALDLRQSTWNKEGELMYYETNPKENKTVLKAFDVSKNQTREIASKFDFPVSQIAQDKNGEIYLFNERERRWYRLEG